MLPGRTAGLAIWEPGNLTNRRSVLLGAVDLATPLIPRRCEPLVEGLVWIPTIRIDANVVPGCRPVPCASNHKPAREQSMTLIFLPQDRREPTGCDQPGGRQTSLVADASRGVVTPRQAVNPSGRTVETMANLEMRRA